MERARRNEFVLVQIQSLSSSIHVDTDRALIARAGCVALLDLLDQVGDVLFVDDPTSDGAKNFTSGGFDDEICTRSGTAAEPTEARRKPSTLCFLVLEV
ncbi:hypothetical protein AgCh_003737 [Apium graveolens]